MSLDAQESSIESGQPIEFYVFTFGVDIIRLTSNNSNITFSGVSYTATQIKRSSLQASTEDAINRLTVNMPLDNTVVQRFIGNVPGTRATIQVLRGHRNDGIEEAVLMFDGFITNVEMDGQLNAKIICKPQTAVFNRSGPLISYQGLCNHVLYDVRCKITRGAFTYTGLASAVVGSVVTVNGLSVNGADWAVGGILQAPTAAPEDRRLIVSQSGDDVTLLLPISFSILGSIVDVLAGCDHSLSICDSKFANVINYGGFPFVPTKNPFNSDIRGGS